MAKWVKVSPELVEQFFIHDEYSLPSIQWMVVLHSIITVGMIALMFRASQHFHYPMPILFFTLTIISFIYALFNVSTIHTGKDALLHQSNAFLLLLISFLAIDISYYERFREFPDTLNALLLVVIFTMLFIPFKYASTILKDRGYAEYFLGIYTDDSFQRHFQNFILTPRQHSNNTLQKKKFTTAKDLFLPENTEPSILNHQSSVIDYYNQYTQVYVTTKWLRVLYVLLMYTLVVSLLVYNISDTYYTQTYL